ncbi:YhcN/YlaJ family sporulation lipoprotein [Sporosarcina thermotolerans]|uniref:YhcN/YlaJ family sporulation lipoprotein n=1 Tax=Sporosarcina thermotolerans TaxID=633404 RepID=A0AAW9A588_9BACL|nr:YhcN/YlaJ family sporulation lipoprotein [Sporosarcina thermotolerans]MDW0115628.1 YhcN/YlaJ family sporulation lipoprotein [Sporosarcina thermotolerans]WHT47083.1 YhcN/YlaJ family sporulation lipoprotein [Sporosarcina thermotolerans]
MRKIALVPLSLVLTVLLIGCGTNNPKTTTDNNAANDVNRTGESAAGTNGTLNNNGTMNNNGTNNNGTVNNTTGETNVEVADDVADKITALKEVESSNVLVTNRNAYIGVVLKKGVKEDEALKTKIADEVRKVRTDFNNVYISFNPEVAQSFTEYGNQIRAGHPVAGFFEEVTTSINRMFPEAR